MKKITEEWLNSAGYDLRLIFKIADDKELTHLVAFHAQQCIEKSLKALLDEKGLDVQKIHNLVTLYNKIKIYLKEPVDIQKLKILDQLYLDSRYPGSLGLLPDGRPSIEEAADFIQFAEKLYNAVRSSLD